VKVCDNLSALFEAKIEVNHGSTNFIEIYRNVKKKINSYEYESINFVLKHVIDSFDSSPDDISL
jgi:hypothetical protein